MSLALAPITHFKGARQPPLFGTLESDDPLFDPLPSGATATFYMRAVNSNTLKINGAAATITSEPANTLRYDWATADVDTAGFFVGWWRVTLVSGQYAESPEFLIWFDDHVPEGGAYISVEELKSSLSLQSSYADADIQNAVVAASRSIDARVGRTFTLGTAGEVRTYETNAPGWVEIDDANAITSVVVNGTAAVSGTDYNQVAGGVGWPITTLESIGGYTFPTRTRVIVVTGQFGWPAVPESVKAAAKIVAARFLTRARAAPFGVLNFGFDGGAANLARFDPDLDLLLSDYERSGGSLAQ